MADTGSQMPPGAGRIGTLLTQPICAPVISHEGPADADALRRPPCEEQGIAQFHRYATITASSMKEALEHIGAWPRRCFPRLRLRGGRL